MLKMMEAEQDVRENLGSYGPSEVESVATVTPEFSCEGRK